MFHGHRIPHGRTDRSLMRFVHYTYKKLKCDCTVRWTATGNGRGPR